MGIRLSLHEKIEGLDIGEHVNSAYPEFLTRKPFYSFAGTHGNIESLSGSHPVAVVKGG